MSTTLNDKRMQLTRRISLMMFSRAATVFITQRRPEDQSVMVAGSMSLDPFAGIVASGPLPAEACLISGVCGCGRGDCPWA